MKFHSRLDSSTTSSASSDIVRSNWRPRQSKARRPPMACTLYTRWEPLQTTTFTTERLRTHSTNTATKNSSDTAEKKVNKRRRHRLPFPPPGGFFAMAGVYQRGGPRLRPKSNSENWHD